MEGGLGFEKASPEGECGWARESGGLVKLTPKFHQLMSGQRAGSARVKVRRVRPLSLLASACMRGFAGLEFWR